MIDAHNHLLDFSKILSPDFAQQTILQRARQNGIHTLLCNASCENDWIPILQLAANSNDSPSQVQIPTVIPLLGIHPWYLDKAHPGWEERLYTLLTQHSKTLIGETGLDRTTHREINNSVQENAFLTHLRLGTELHRPVTIHSVRAWESVLSLLKEQSSLPPALLFHAYNGGREYLKPLLRLSTDIYFSFAGTALFERNHRAHEALSLIPIERLLLETDSPYLAGPSEYLTGLIPQSSDKPHSEPSDLRLLLKGFAQLLHTSAEELENRIENNLSRFLSSLTAL